MKRTVLRLRGFGTVLAVGLIAWGAGHPAPAWSHDSCSLKTLKGTYLSQCNGFLESAQKSVRTHIAAACKDQFHGDGSLSGVCTSTDKDHVFSHVSYSGTYTLNPDCSGIVTTTDENKVVTNLEIYAAPGGAKFSAIIIDPGVVDEVLEERVSRDDRY